MSLHAPPSQPRRPGQCIDPRGIMPRNQSRSWVRRAGRAMLQRQRELALHQTADGDSRALMRTVDHVLTPAALPQPQVDNAVVVSQTWPTSPAAPPATAEALAQWLELPPCRTPRDVDACLGRVIDALELAVLTPAQARLLAIFLGSLRRRLLTAPVIREGFAAP
ncbi:MAG: hypothetical protein H7831_10580 [Magnetococcus sp. WYHC-3]